MNTFIKEETLGQRIRAQRIRLGMTQEELAEEMCVPKSTISAYENDRVDIKSSVIVELSKLLETNPNYLLGAVEYDADVFGYTWCIEKDVSRPEKGCFRTDESAGFVVRRYLFSHYSVFKVKMADLIHAMFVV